MDHVKKHMDNFLFYFLLLCITLTLCCAQLDIPANKNYHPRQQNEPRPPHHHPKLQMDMKPPPYLWKQSMDKDHDDPDKNQDFSPPSFRNTRPFGNNNNNPPHEFDEEGESGENSKWSDVKNGRPPPRKNYGQGGYKAIRRPTGRPFYTDNDAHYNPTSKNKPRDPYSTLFAGNSRQNDYNTHLYEAMAPPSLNSDNYYFAPTFTERPFPFHRPNYENDDDNHGNPPESKKQQRRRRPPVSSISLTSSSSSSRDKKRKQPHQPHYHYQNEQDFFDDHLEYDRDPPSSSSSSKRRPPQLSNDKTRKGQQKQKQNQQTIEFNQEKGPIYYDVDELFDKTPSKKLERRPPSLSRDKKRKEQKNKNNDDIFDVYDLYENDLQLLPAPPPPPESYMDFSKYDENKHKNLQRDASFPVDLFDGGVEVAEPFDFENEDNNSVGLSKKIEHHADHDDDNLDRPKSSKIKQDEEDSAVRSSKFFEDNKNLDRPSKQRKNSDRPRRIKENNNNNSDRQSKKGDTNNGGRRNKNSNNSIRTKIKDPVVSSSQKSFGNSDDDWSENKERSKTKGRKNNRDFDPDPTPRDNFDSAKQLEMERSMAADMHEAGWRMLAADYEKKPFVQLNLGSLIHGLNEACSDWLPNFMKFGGNICVKNNNSGNYNKGINRRGGRVHRWNEISLVS